MAEISPVVDNPSRINKPKFEPRPWAKNTRNQGRELDQALIKRSISKALESHQAQQKRGRFEDVRDSDGGALFCKSLILQLQRLPPQVKQLAKIQIQQTIYNCEFFHADGLWTHQAHQQIQGQMCDERYLQTL